MKRKPHEYAISKHFRQYAARRGASVAQAAGIKKTA
jgi:hypothetical protein